MRFRANDEIKMSNPASVRPKAFAMWRWLPVAAFVAAAVCVVPAAAQQAGAGPAPLSLSPYPTDAGKPVIFGPRFIARSDEDKGCAPGFSCRLRLLGVIQNNGAVELRATAFRW
jgi:hypothetical protein